MVSIRIEDATVVNRDEMEIASLLHGNGIKGESSTR